MVKSIKCARIQKILNSKLSGRPHSRLVVVNNHKLYMIYT